MIPLCQVGVALDANGICSAPDSKIMDVDTVPASGIRAQGRKVGYRYVVFPFTIPTPPQNSSIQHISTPSHKQNNLLHPQ
jgi:hypothetical protein